MLDQNDRLAKFLDVIKQDEQNRRLQIEKETADECERQLREYTAKIRSEARTQADREIAKLRTQSNRAISEAEAESRKKLSDKREQITGKVFGQAEKKLLEYTETEKYADLLKTSCEQFGNIFTAGDTVIYVNPRDMKYGQLIKEAFGGPCEVTADASIRIGGCKAVSELMALRADDTLDSRLEQQHGDFLLKCGLSVTDNAPAKA